MARTTGRAPLVLSTEQRSMLEELASSRTASLREVERAKVLPAYAQGKAPTGVTSSGCDASSSHSAIGHTAGVHLC